MVDAVNAALKTSEAVGNFWTGYRAYLAARPHRDATGATEC
jgi:hypothetical protein